MMHANVWREKTIHEEAEFEVQTIRPAKIRQPGRLGVTGALFLRQISDGLCTV